MTLIRLTYASTSMMPRDQSGKMLAELVRSSTERNQRFRITGTLIYTGFHFAQMIEGREIRVSQLMANIERDNRHRGCVVIDRGPIKKRLNSDWLLRYDGVSTYIEDIIVDVISDHADKRQRSVARLKQLFLELAS